MRSKMTKKARNTEKIRKAFSSCKVWHNHIFEAVLSTVQRDTEVVSKMDKCDLLLMHLSDILTKKIRCTRDRQWFLKERYVKQTGTHNGIHSDSRP